MKVWELIVFGSCAVLIVFTIAVIATCFVLRMIGLV